MGGSDHTRKCYTRPKKLARDKRTSLFCQSMTKEKRFNLSYFLIQKPRFILRDYGSLTTCNGVKGRLLALLTIILLGKYLPGQTLT